LSKALCGLLELKANNPALINYIPTKLEIFDEYMEVGEFLELSRYDSKTSIDDVLEILGISYLKDKPTKYISSGESQLVLLASSLLHNCTFTIFDEPTSNLDPLKTSKIFNILNSTKYFDKKIIITHDFNLAYHLGYDILYMQEGKIKFRKTSKEFFAQSFLDEIFDGFVINQDNNIIVRLRS
jgi:iron complex transport system ATP-binding protein